MTAEPATRSRKSPKRDLLLDAAFRLFYLSGYHAVGIDTILAEAGVAKMTLYNHFKSKDDLIVGALERRAEEIQDARSAALADAGDDPMVQLSTLFDAYGAWFRSEDFNGCAFIRAISEYPDQASKVNQAVRQQKQVLIDLLEKLTQKLNAAEPSKLAQQIYLLAEGSILRAHTFKDPDAAQTAKEAALELAQSAKRSA